jgi:tRNA A37 threonylcarbamoyltransferase TsaD
MSKGRFIEMMAQFGDPSELELPLGLKNDQNADLSFTGLKTAIQSAVSLNP